MALTQMEFTPATGFRDPVAFPDPATESDARDQVQDIPDQLRDYINNNLLPDLLSTSNGKGASQIGVEDSGGKYTGVTVEAVLLEISNLISNHTGETVSQYVSATRDMTVTGTQTIACSGLPKMIRAKAMVSATYKRSDGVYCQNSQGSIYHNAGGYVYDGAAYPLIIEDSNGNYTAGTIGSVTNGSFVITWTKTGSGGTGTAALKFEILYH